MEILVAAREYVPSSGWCRPLRLAGKLAVAVAFTAVLIFSAGPVSSQAASDYALLSAEFDARRLNKHEKREIQRALVYTGDYRGLLDGEWGGISQRALEAYSVREFGDLIVPNVVVAVLLGSSFEDIERSGAELVQFEPYPLTLELPLNVVGLEDGDRSGRIYQSEDEKLKIILNHDGYAKPVAFHSKIRASFTHPELGYVVDREDRVVSSYSTDRAGVYVRSDNTDAGWLTVSVFAIGEEYVRHLRIISSTISNSLDLSWRRQDLQLLVMIMEAAQRVAKEQPSESDETFPVTASGRTTSDGRGQPGRSESKGSGSGFFVNGSDIVTNNHVVKDCGRVETIDGEPLRVVYRDQEADLALLSGMARSRTWLAVSPDNAIALGQETFVLGFPYFGLASQSISYTRGVISSRTGLGGNDANFTLSAPIQPGNSGGPVLDELGRVVGVAVARISDFAVAEATGSLPQNINYAVKGSVLRRFLDEAGALVADANKAPLDLRRDPVPEWVEKAVIPIICR